LRDPTGEDGKLRADDGTEFAVDARVFLTRRNLRIVITLAVDVAGDLEHLFGAEVNTELAAFAAFRDDVHLPTRNVDLVQINRCSREDLH
jgi:hypothetical protein